MMLIGLNDMESTFDDGPLGRIHHLLILGHHILNLSLEVHEPEERELIR